MVGSSESAILVRTLVMGTVDVGERGHDENVGDVVCGLLRQRAHSGGRPERGAAAAAAGAQ